MFTFGRQVARMHCFRWKERNRKCVRVCMCVCARARVCGCGCMCVGPLWELPSRHLSHGPRKRWRDVARSDLAVVGIPESDWYDVAQDRGEWRKLSRRPFPPPPESAMIFQCMCGRILRWRVT